jgi:hypothetical protein
LLLVAGCLLTNILIVSQLVANNSQRARSVLTDCNINIFTDIKQDFEKKE